MDLESALCALDTHSEDKRMDVSRKGRGPFLYRHGVDTARRTVYIYSNEGDKKTVECDTPEEFMNVLNYVRENVSTDTLSYVDPL